MAVAARTPSPSDGRLPCPHCGGLVHPIAGRCRHCKVDLAAQRSTRPPAAAALPALAGAGNARRDTPVMGVPDAPAPAPSPIRALAKAAQETPDPVLPQRPNHSGRMEAQPGRSILRNWPVMVIILAGIAIAAAVVIMVWPASKTAKADSHLTPPPAPERMDTNPLPPQGSLTPTPTPPKGGTQNNGGGPDPWADPKNDQTNIDPSDPSKDPMNPNSGGGLGGNPFAGSGSGNNMTLVMMKHLCNRMSNCGNAMAGQMCQLFDQMTGSVTPPSCAAAQRCVDRLDQLDCNTAQMSSMADATNLFQAIQDCTDASLRC